MVGCRFLLDPRFWNSNLHVARCRIQSDSFWGRPCRLMRPQCGNLVIAASESSEKFFFAVHVLPLSKERYRLAGFRNKLVTFALPFCHFLRFRRLFIFTDIFRIC